MKGIAWTPLPVGLSCSNNRKFMAVYW